MTWTLTRRVSPRLVEVPHTQSTNADLVRALAAGEEWPHLGALLTRDQRGGRGRLGRTWTTAPDQALAVSVVLRVPHVPAERRGWIPLVAGAAMAEAAGEQLGRRAGVKWPNDVLVGARKLCGILAEIAAPDAIVLGSGVNTRMTADELPVPTATSFATEGVDVDEDRLLATYLGRLDALLTGLVDGSSREAVRDACSTIGQAVAVHLPDGSIRRGTAEGLDDEGRLVVDGWAVSAGDIVHLRPA
ncbi:biotin--[acetyl-CoA-carboxylase] ligase [Microbacterium sp. gxy059]|uniref:biotin--[acetyl-CoA-carboxylase] ligase n=1 Tax=Microbacterium sp. gxy059 TaxID=2957199 RepID=UPI003D97A8D9